jgi:NAD(P)-dependent dehydrogenase (short-subunit alcohol dehydrogenase family)
LRAGSSVILNGSIAGRIEFLEVGKHCGQEKCMSKLDGKIALITGGDNDIGLATAKQFVNEVVADTGNPEDAPRTVANAVQRWGRLDVLVNNAAAGAIMPLAETSVQRVKDIFAVNVLGPSMLAKEALPHLKSAKGSIINISSTFGHKATAGLSHYAGSKAALEHLTRCWALELAPYGIRVNAVAVGPTESGALEGMMGLSREQAEAVKEQERNQIPLGRRGNPEEVAFWITTLATHSSEWVTGQILAIDGGLSVV